MSLYDRITEYAGIDFGEDLWCLHCKEVKAVCPDCGAAFCVTCGDYCPGCEQSIW